MELVNSRCYRPVRYTCECSSWRQVWGGEKGPSLDPSDQQTLTPYNIINSTTVLQSLWLARIYR